MTSQPDPKDGPPQDRIPLTDEAVRQLVASTGPTKHGGGRFDAPCEECGVKLHGEGLPSVNLRNGVPYSYCYECGTTQHPNFKSAAPRAESRPNE